MIFPGRYARLSDDKTEILVDESVPWGNDTLLTFEFCSGENKYAIHTGNNMYLNKDGKLAPEISPDCLYTIEYNNGYIAFKEQGGLYLSATGSKGVLKTLATSSAVTSAEQFTLEDSLPQGSFMSRSNSRYVSTKQGNGQLRTMVGFLTSIDHRYGCVGQPG